MGNKLPGYNCKQCGFDTCEGLSHSNLSWGLCPFYKKEEDKVSIMGVIDNLDADFTLGPINGESSCREFVLPLSRVPIQQGDIVKYRPLGCPVTHFAKVFQANDKDLFIGIHLVGPLGNHDAKDIGICMVLYFEGLVTEGQVPDPCKTVRFIPKHCMMKKVHTAVCTHSEGKMVRLEGIDLKVWGRA